MRKFLFGYEFFFSPGRIFQLFVFKQLFMTIEQMKLLIELNALLQSFFFSLFKKSIWYTIKNGRIDNGMQVCVWKGDDIFSNHHANNCLTVWEPHTSSINRKWNEKTLTAGEKKKEEETGAQINTSIKINWTTKLKKWGNRTYTNTH